MKSRQRRLYAMWVGALLITALILQSILLHGSNADARTQALIYLVTMLGVIVGSALGWVLYFKRRTRSPSGTT